MSAVSITKRTKEQGRRNVQARVRQIHLSVGDYVLVGSLTRRQSKLKIRWLGPRRVVQTITDWVFVV